MARSPEEIDAVIAALGTHGFGGINPTEAQLRELLTEDRGGPLQFINLLRYRDTAQYPVGHELADAGLTGQEAYLRYSAVTMEQIGKRGGRLALFNHGEQVLIGTDDHWHHVAAMEYPDTEAFVSMLLDPEYVAGSIHRTAGLAATVIVVTRAHLPA